MKKLIVAFSIFASCLFANEINIKYQLLDRNEFEKVVVGNSVVGMTRQSHSLYILWFKQDGLCELWKGNKIYPGKWWIEKDIDNRDIVRAFWPSYTSSEPKSLFSPENPRFGEATSIGYYRNSENGALLLVGKKFALSALLIPGCCFPCGFDVLSQ